MLKYLLGAVALLLAGVPAYLGLTSNASFSREVPVRVPEQAQVATPTPAPARTVAPTRTPAPTHAGDDDDGTPDQGHGDRPRTRHTEAGDDHGGDRPRVDRTEAGDDHGGDRPRDDRTEAGDDHDGSHGGSDDGSGHD